MPLIELAHSGFQLPARVTKIGAPAEGLNKNVRNS